MEAIKFPLNVAKVLDEVATLVGRKAEDIAIEAVLKHLEDIEDNLAVEESIAGAGQSIRLEELMAQEGVTPEELETLDLY